MSPRFVFTAAAVFLLFSGCGSESPSGGGPMGRFGAPTTPAVEVIQARVGSLPLEQRLSGIVRAVNQVMIYPEISAPVERVAVRNGDTVQAGDALVYLRDQQFQDQLRQAEAQLQLNEADAERTQAALNEAEARFARAEELFKKELQSQQQFDAAMTDVASARAAHLQALARIAQAESTVRERQEALRRTIVRAPFSGMVGQRNVDAGQRVDTNTPLFMIGDFDEVRVEVSITDGMMSRIERGQTALISIDGRPDTLITARMSRISPFLEAGSFSASAEIDVPNPGRVLRPGMFVAVDVLYGESQQATLVPESALFEHPTSGLMGVFVAPSLAQETPIEEPDEFDPSNPPPLTEATPVQFRPVNVMARGRGVAGVTGIVMGDWVVTVGQDMLASRTGDVSARARPVPWQRVASLQALQDQDLLLQFMEKQQRLADSVRSSGSTTDAASAPSSAAAAATAE
ncbi:MAG: efflux RND transporter periplasmic adaptor subunit [Rhodothermales bacterium]